VLENHNNLLILMQVKFVENIAIFDILSFNSYQQKLVGMNF
jgi:hypothetical protein